CPANCVNGIAGKALAAVEDPAGTMMVLDSRYYRIWFDQILSESQALTEPLSDGTCRDGVDSTGVPMARCVKPRHLNTIAVAFADGHAKALQWQTVLGGTNS